MEWSCSVRSSVPGGGVKSHCASELAVALGRGAQQRGQFRVDLSGGGAVFIAARVSQEMIVPAFRPPERKEWIFLRDIGTKAPQCAGRAVAERQRVGPLPVRLAEKEFWDGVCRIFRSFLYFMFMFFLFAFPFIFLSCFHPFACFSIWNFFYISHPPPFFVVFFQVFDPCRVYASLRAPQIDFPKHTGSIVKQVFDLFFSVFRSSVFFLFPPCIFCCFSFLHSIHFLYHTKNLVVLAIT